MMDLVKLYKPEANGKVRTWGVWTEGDKVFVRHGLEGGKLQTKETKVEGKNIGKANETTPEAQAIKVARSKWKAQKDRKGYGITPDTAEVGKRPMLALDFNNHGHRITYPAGVQAKLDGVRCLVTKVDEGHVTLTSRTGRTFPADLSHIEDWFDANLEVGVVLDGELYNHDMEFEDIQSATQKTNTSTPDIEFWVFDIADASIDNGRRAGALSFGLAPDGPVRLVKTETALNVDDVKRWHKRYTTAGFEGVMVRNKLGKYKFGRRSGDLQKYKVFMDAEFPILAINPDKDGCPVFTLAHENGTFESSMVGDKDANKQYVRDVDEYLGRYVTVQYQKLFRDSKIPQFPIIKGFRDVGPDGSPTS
jgi:DNA ligase-1